MKKILVSATVLLSVFLYTGCKEKTSNENINLTKEVTFTKQGELSLLKAETDSVVATFNIEIADDEYKTQTGLMYRSSMEDNQAMLFIFPDERMRSFFMKNTEFSLDILYFDANKKLINLHRETQPFNEASLPSSAPAKYVLEINGGLSEQWNLEAGDKMEFNRND
jgi:uncharacterized membrane protein (UPF0127 family)